MKIRSYTYQMFIYLVLCYSIVSGKNFIFDFGGVLIDTDKYASFQHLGMLNVAEYTIRLRISPFNIDHHIKAALFTTLNAIAQEHNLEKTDSYCPAYDEKGNLLPFLMCTWLQGNMTCTEIRYLINHTVPMHPEWFKCHAEQRIIQNLLRMIFTPRYFVNSRKISAEGIAFIKKCKREGHKIYGLSNWDPESFALLKEKYPQLFDLFDGIIISGETNTNKPHATIYQALLERYDLDPQQCWFIDDQEENIAAAQKLGINAVIHKTCFKKLIQNIKLAYSKSVTRRENFKNNGIIATNTNNTNNAIIDGENISLTDSTIYNCLPANA
ncbi:MAG TPA: HAD family phosphatase [Candidatus Babeliales bacterium]|jgi:FMN phosphatase YigB (HAD superfamily)|nr:HAD family phosphatase [Candidatus Babeliales bacterium]